MIHSTLKRTKFNSEGKRADMNQRIIVERGLIEKYQFILFKIRIYIISLIINI